MASKSKIRSPKKTSNALVGPDEKVRWIIALGIMAIVCFFAFYWAPDPKIHPKAGPWTSVLPPLIAVTVALGTNRLITSLIAAVAIGGFLAAFYHHPVLLSTVGDGLIRGPGYVIGTLADSTYRQILLFVALILALISILIVGGGLQAVANWLSKFAKGPKSTQFVTALMGMVVFIDDYANSMIVGSSMRPISDAKKVSREKLAFLVDATAAPISGIAIVSTWIGYEAGLFGSAAKALGVDKSGYAVFFDALPFRFYCYLMIAFVFINIFLGKDFGPMAKAQKRAQKGQVSAKNAKPLTSESYTMLSPYSRAKIRISSALIPVSVLILVLLGGIWFDGGGAQLSASDLFSIKSWRAVISAGSNTTALLAFSVTIAVLAAGVCVRFISQVPVDKIIEGALSGVKSSFLPMFILILAWSLKSACDDLSTGAYLVATFSNNLSAAWFPMITFIIAGMVAFSTGTSWGTMAILIPVVGPLAFQLDGGTYGLITMICFGAVLDGAIFGDHCSPISDTTILSSISSSCDHLHHVKTQMPYALLVGALAIVCGYLPAAMGISPLVGVGLGAVLCMPCILIGYKLWGEKI